MNEEEMRDKELLIKVNERSKSNTHQIEEIKEDVREMKSDIKSFQNTERSLAVISTILENLVERNDRQDALQGRMVDSLNDLQRNIDSMQNSTKALAKQCESMNNQLFEMKADYETRFKQTDEIITEVKNSFDNRRLKRIDNVFAKVGDNIIKVMTVGAVAYILSQIIPFIKW